MSLSAAKDLSGYLVTCGLGSSPSLNPDVWHIGYAREPTNPIKCLTLYDTGGRGPDTQELDVRRPSVQLRVRCKDYDEAMNKIGAASSRLLNMPTQYLNGTRYIALNQETEIIDGGVTENGFFILTVNFIALSQ